MFFWLTSPCALADDASKAVMTKLAKALELDDISELPVDFARHSLDGLWTVCRVLPKTCNVRKCTAALFFVRFVLSAHSTPRRLPTAVGLMIDRVAAAFFG
jgi:hypothetical protein